VDSYKHHIQGYTGIFQWYIGKYRPRRLNIAPEGEIMVYTGKYRKNTGSKCAPGPCEHPHISYTGIYRKILVIYSKYRVWEAKYRPGRGKDGIYRKKQEKYRLEVWNKGL
jgi:hypothetical protein